MIRFSLFIFLFPLFAYSQDSLSHTPSQHTLPAMADTAHTRSNNTPRNYLRKDVWRVDFTSPGYLNEHRIGRQLSLVSQIRLVGTFRIEEEYSPYSRRKVLSMSINPDVSVAVRHFYNLAKRKKERKVTRYNSGSYFALKGNYIGPPIYRNNNDNIQGLGASALWGVQNTAPRHFYINFEVGFGVAQYYANAVSPTGNLILGYTL